MNLFVGIFLIGLYVRWLLVVASGLFVKRYTKVKDVKETKSIAIVIAFRNEAENLPKILPIVQSVVSKNNQLQCILVDDHSEDKSWQIAESYCSSNIQVLRSKGEGKKSALHTAITSTDAKIIFTLDADIIVSEENLEQSIRYIQLTDASFFILPLMMEQGSDAWSNLQHLEYATVFGMTMGTALSRYPIMCNGGYLAFQKSLYMEVFQHRNHSTYSSGDDMFLLQFVRENYRSWSYPEVSQTIAYFRPEKTMEDFWRQRVRWAGKKASFTSHAITIGTVVLVAQVYTIIVLYPQCMISDKRQWFFLLLLIKWGVEVYFIAATLKRLQTSGRWSLLPLLLVVYPFYAILVPVFSWFQPTAWKGRLVKKGN